MSDRTNSRPTYEDDDLVDERVAAAMLDMSVAWLQRDRWAGASVPYVKLGRSVRYRVGDVRETIRKRTVAAA